MCPQFVDFDGDGYTDIITATYAGSPFIVRGSAAGWQQPELIVNAQGEPIMLSIYWDFDNTRWSNADGTAMGAYNAEGHCISAAVMDWDEDGDFDLLIGSYGGLLFLHRNEGEPGTPKFTVENEPVLVGGKPFKLEGGLTAPRMVDWDGDGLTDMVTGGFKGGVYLYRNAGEPGAPKFEAPKTLIAKHKPAVGGPHFPTSGLYVDPVDYDDDGDFDLLVGGYSEWTPEPRELSDADQTRLEKLQAEMEEIQIAMQEAMASIQEEIDAAESQEEVQAIYQELTKQEDYQKQSARRRELWLELSQLQQRPQREAGVWLYRRK